MTFVKNSFPDDLYGYIGVTGEDRVATSSNIYLTPSDTLSIAVLPGAGDITTNWNDLSIVYQNS
jgi:hypothetical protein